MIWSVIILLVLLIPILAIVLDSSVGRALAQRLERRELGGDAVGTERMAYLEGEVERLASEVHRLDEESQFLHKLLTERAGGDKPPEALPKGGGDDAPA
jgi:hypothetical protein